MPAASVFPRGLPVASRSILRAHGVTNDRIRTAVRTGRWQEPLRGIVVPHGGAPTQRERWLAALEYAGPHAALSHHSALRLWGARADELGADGSVAGVRGDYCDVVDGGMVEVSTLHGRHMASHGFVVVHQSRRPMHAVEWRGLRTTGAARAAVDVSLSATRRQDVDHVIADVLQKGLTSVEQLIAETTYAGRAATPWLRAAVADAARGMRSVGESDLRRVIAAAGLPEPEWGARIETPVGVFYLDALWRDKGIAAEADGRAYHLSAADWQADLRRQNAIHGVGVVLLRYPVPRLRSEGPACAEELRRLIS